MIKFVPLQIYFILIATTALCRALWLLLCRKLDIPSYAKPIKPTICEVIIHLFSFLSFGRFGKIKNISFVKILCTVQLKEEICSL